MAKRPGLLFYFAIVTTALYYLHFSALKDAFAKRLMINNIMKSRPKFIVSLAHQIINDII